MSKVMWSCLACLGLVAGSALWACVPADAEAGCRAERRAARRDSRGCSGAQASYGCSGVGYRRGGCAGSYGAGCSASYSIDLRGTGTGCGGIGNAGVEVPSKPAAKMPSPEAAYSRAYKDALASGKKLQLFVGMEPTPTTADVIQVRWDSCGYDQGCWIGQADGKGGMDVVEHLSAVKVMASR